MSSASPSIPLRRLLPRWGVLSRGESDLAVVAGRLLVNGEVVRDAAILVDPNQDVIELDGSRVGQEPRIYVMLNKPVGVVTTVRDPEGRRTVRDLVAPEFKRGKPVGRLDRDSCGLLLLTTDGDLHFSITGPNSSVEKIYRVKVAGKVDDSRLAPLRDGIELDGERLKPMAAKVVSLDERTTSLEMRLIEGRFRQIRRSLHQLGLRVIALERIAIGPLCLGELPPGASRALSDEEIESLRAAAR